jgi:hypothetical protein
LRSEVEAELQKLLVVEGAERPSATRVRKKLAEYCRRRRLPVPSRATVYNALLRVAVPSYRRDALPNDVNRTLHNVGGNEVPGDQVVFAAFNYGDTRALSYAAALPWPCLLRASRLRGWRPKSAALLRAVMMYRGI